MREDILNLPSENEFLKGLLDIPSETQTIEFKRMGDERVVSKTIETVVAMANTDGGIIVLGIDDPQKTKLKGLDRVFGVEENLEIFDEIGRELQKIIPPLSGVWLPNMLEVKQNNNRVGVLFVPKAVDSFRSIHNHVYIRLEKGNHRLTAHEIVKFAYAKGFQKADRELVSVDFALLKTLIYEEWKASRRLNGGSIEAILEKTGLARKDDKGTVLPTRAAVLLFAEYPSDIMDTKCTVRILQYTGTIETIGGTPNLIGIPKTIQGPLVRQIADVHEYVLTLLRSGIRMPSGFKTEYLIPERALKEAITNAVIHRDYHMKRDIEVKIYEDRVEVESPGLFPYNITRMNIGRERAEGYRNDLLVKHLRDFPLPPNLDQNEGVKAMRNEMMAQNLYPPIFLTYPLLEDSVRVVLLNEKRVSEWEKISSYLKEHKYIANEEARKLTRVDQRDKMSRMLKNWVKRGLLIQIVPASKYVKDTKYKLPDDQEVRR